MSGFRHHVRPFAASAGFTLIELLVSIALVVMLLLGINAVFSMASWTVGDGVNLSTLNRERRSAQSVIENDLRHAAPDMPFMVLECTHTRTFRNREAGAEERFRTDIFNFFSRGHFRRQTGNNAGSAQQFVAPMSSCETWIVLAHLRLHGAAAEDVNKSASYKYPGEGDSEKNPHNYYANQWVLGRNAILLRVDQGGKIYDDDGVSQDYISRNTGRFSALTANTTAASGAPLLIQTSRLDLAGTCFDAERNALARYISAPPANSSAWWADLHYRFWAHSQVAKPLTSRQMAQISPDLLGSCSNFIVEFAGDYLTQDNKGQVISVLPDGRIDFIGSGVAGTVQKVRWYGLPRDINGDGAIPGGLNQLDPNLLVDVVPLRDLRLAANAGPAGFEGTLPTLRSNYAAMSVSEKYLCAWGPADPKPRLIRITFTLEPPDGSHLTGQTFEHVVELP